MGAAAGILLTAGIGSDGSISGEEELSQEKKLNSRATRRSLYIIPKSL
jgi:hypothetical protein